ncbi:hypothetical protein AB6C94_18615, partial [Vibrio splendidus]
GMNSLSLLINQTCDQETAPQLPLDSESNDIWKKLLKLGYAKNTESSVSASLSVSLAEAKTLLKAINDSPKTRRTPFRFNWNLN